MDTLFSNVKKIYCYFKTEVDNDLILGNEIANTNVQK